MSVKSVHFVNADPTFVRKSLSKLSKAGLVVTKRGKSGASVLARSPRQITLLDILVARNEVESTRADAARAAALAFRALGGGWDIRSNPSIAAVK